MSGFLLFVSKAFAYCNSTENAKPIFLLLLKEVCQYNILLTLSEWKKNMSSAVDGQNGSQKLGPEILNSLN
jgi:hypothetical protein